MVQYMMDPAIFSIYVYSTVCMNTHSMHSLIAIQNFNNMSKCSRWDALPQAEEMIVVGLIFQEGATGIGLLNSNAN